MPGTNRGWALREQVEVGRNRVTAGEGCFEVFSFSKGEDLGLRRLRYEDRKGFTECKAQKARAR